jgi:hypothetical protein
VCGFIACSLGLSALLGVKWFIDFIIACGFCNERQVSVNRIIYSLSLLNDVISVNFILDIDGNVYEVPNDNDETERALF